MLGALSMREEVPGNFKMSFGFGATWHVRALQLHVIFLEAPSILVPVGGGLARPSYAFELKSLQKGESRYKAVDAPKYCGSGLCDGCVSCWLKSNFGKLLDCPLFLLHRLVKCTWNFWEDIGKRTW